MLADFGARVIKLEPKGVGDIARAWGTPLPGGETAYFVSLHRNKQGIEVAINSIAQVVNHPQVKARGTLVEMNHPRAGKLGMSAADVDALRGAGVIGGR